MAQANFSFFSDATGGGQFTVVNFSGSEAISSLYRYEIEIKAPLSAAVVLDDVLDSPARFITELDDQEYPVYGVLSSIDELQTVQGYVHYRAVLVPKLWRLSIYKTNEIYIEEKTVDNIIQVVLENAGFTDGNDFDLNGLDNSRFLERDYVCQFGESDFDFISRLMEKEGIFYYFEHGGGPSEKIIFINDMNYLEISRPGLIFDVAAQANRQHDCIDAWSCRKQRLPANVTVRDFNPAQPSLDISDTAPIDSMGQGTEYIYGDNITGADEATYLSEIRAAEQLCTKTRYFGESGVTRLQAGYLFALDQHPNTNYNGVEYLTIEVSHQGQRLDMNLSDGSRRKAKSKPQYRNSFVAIEASEQYRPPRKTIEPRFFGTMTAFVFSETDSMNAEIDEFGRYRVHLPFDRADGTMNSTDPDRKASTWMRMAQPYVGQEQGMYFPLAGGTEVLLTFINGDPDQPVISGALPNAAQPSLLTSESNLQRTITAQVSQTVTGNTHVISQNSAAIALLQNPPAAPDPTVQGREFINQGETQATAASSMLPPWSIPADDPDYNAADPYDASYIQFNKYAADFSADPMVTADLSSVSTDRSGGDNYVYANARTFAYPQHERVFFIGTFHEDFHVKDGFMDPDESWTGVKEQWNFPEPGGVYPDGTAGDTHSDDQVNPNGIRGVSEDKRWGDQMTYVYGRSFNWSGGTAMGDGGAFAVYNYGNGYTENLLESDQGTSADLTDKDHADDYESETRIDTTKATIEKTFGATYSYQNGFSYDVKVGDSRSETYGDTHEEVHGHVVSHVYGSSHSTQQGAVSEMFFGAKNEFAFDYTNSMCAGAATEFYGGLKGEFSLAGTLGMFGGNALEVYVGGKQEFSAAIILEYAASVKLGATAGPDLSSEGIKVSKREVVLKKVLTELKKTGFEVTSADIKLYA